MADFRPTGDPDYFIARESQERRLADRATDRAVRRVHLTLAAHYATLTRDRPASPAQPTAT